MTHWKLTLSYDGTGFHGWQVQPGRATVQGALARALAAVTGEQVLPQGSGRTDAGVHALGQVASFSLEIEIPPPNLRHALNRVLPASIRVLAAEEVSPEFHARHGARAKTYEYRIFERRIRAKDAVHERVCSPFLAPFVWDCRWPLDFAAMEAAAPAFCGTHDFTSFAASDPDLTTRESADAPRSNVRSIFSSEWTRADGLLVYRVTGNGFLHHMVRNIVGTLVDVGRGRTAVSGIENILAARDRAAAGPTAPASGLFLLSVEYDEASA